MPLCRPAKSPWRTCHEAGLSLLAIEARRLALAVVAMLGWLVAEWRLRGPSASASDLIRVLFYGPLVRRHGHWRGHGRSFRRNRASRSLPALRFGHVAMLLTWNLLTLELLTLGKEQPGAWLMLARNLSGFAGLALLSTRITGSRLSWVVPLAYAVLALLTGAVGSDGFATWAWPLQPPTDGLALTIALVLLGAGLSVLVLFGARNRQGEVE